MAFNAATGMWELDAPTSKGAAAAKIPVLPQTPEALAEVAKMTRAARVAQFGESAVAAMEAAGQRFGAGITAPAAATAAPAVTPAQGFIARELPTFAKGFGALRSAASTVAPFVAPTVEAGRVVASAVDPTQSKGETGLRTLMGAGRLAGMGAGAIGGGALGGPVGAFAGGAAGYLLPDVAEAASRWFRGGGSPTPASQVHNLPPMVPGSQLAVDPNQVNAGPPVPPASGFGALPPVTPFTAEDIRGTSRVPVPGTGGFVNTRTGAVTNLDTRAAQAAEGVGATPYQPRSPAAQFFGATARMRQAAKIEDRAAAQAKLSQELALRLPSAVKAQAETVALTERIRLANLEPDPIKRAAILAGRNPPEVRLQSPVNMQPLPGSADQSAVTFDPSKGTYTRVPIRQSVSLVQGTDGKTYKRDAAGKLVEATPAELAAYRAAQQQRGFGAVR